jgi:CRP-like cAMP-binding protein/Fe-S-cluster-containing hydrogenase component 2
VDAILIYKDGKYHGRRVLEGKEVLIGRGGTLVLDSPEVSRRHAALTRGPQGYFLRDVGSTEGTRVNDQPIAANVDTLIFSGDQIGIGTYTLRCIFAASEAELLAAEKAPLPKPAALFDGLAGTMGRIPLAPSPPPAAPPPAPAPPPAAPAPAPLASAPTPLPGKVSTGTQQWAARADLAALVPQAPLAALPPLGPSPAAPPPPAPGSPSGGEATRRRPQTGTLELRTRPDLAPSGPASPPAAPPPGPLYTASDTPPAPPPLKAPSLFASPGGAELAALRGGTVPSPAAQRRTPAALASPPQKLYLDSLPVGFDRREGKGVLPEGAETLTVEQWLAFDIFADIPKDRVRKHLERYEDQHPIWVRRYKRGECIVREGEYGSTAFYILHGEVQVFIAARLGGSISGIRAPARRPEEPPGLLRRLLGLGGGGGRPGEPPRPRTIPIDATVDLDMATPVATLVEGDVFGEMTCMNFYPRSATVRASSDEVVCFEMLRSVLVDLLQRNSKRFKDKLEQAYRTRALDGHLRGVPMFADLTQSFIDHLRTRVELVGPLEPGEVICKEGEPADAFYLVRLGFVKVSQQHPGGEMVLAYLGRGQYFGEIGILEDRPRMATCSALDRVELVKIRREDFDLLCAQNPGIKAKLIAGSAERQDSVRALAERAVSTSVHLDDFIAQGLINAQSVLLIDLERCTRCDECVRACAESHGGVPRLIRDGLRFDRYLVTSSCRACADPVCMVGCPVGSIRRRGSLEIVIEDWCIGCGKCSNQCPYGNIHMVDFPETRELPGGRRAPALDEHGAPKMRTQATTCDLSYGRSEPACVYACPHEAALRVSPRKFFGL